MSELINNTIAAYDMFLENEIVFEDLKELANQGLISESLLIELDNTMLEEATKKHTKHSNHLNKYLKTAGGTLAGAGAAVAATHHDKLAAMYKSMKSAAEAKRKELEKLDAEKAKAATEKGGAVAEKSNNAVEATANKLDASAAGSAEVNSHIASLLKSVGSKVIDMA